jgi:cell division septal protein FtsQ
MANPKKPRRKSNSATTYIAVSVLLIIGFTLFGLSFFTRANEIEVNGVIKYSVREVIDASGFSVGDNLIGLNTDNAEVRIQTLLPHISEVEIIANFPNKIIINVVESSPIATLRHRNGILIIDSGARVVEILSHDDPVPIGLIEIRGFTPTGAELGGKMRVELANESQLQYLIDTLVAIEDERLYYDVTYIDISNIANITFDYLSRFRVILDSPNNIAQNIELLKNTIADAEREGSIQPGMRGTIRVDDAQGVFGFLEDR